MNRAKEVSPGETPDSFGTVQSGTVVWQLFIANSKASM